MVGSAYPDTWPNFAEVDFLNEAFFPWLEHSWPPLRLFCLKGQIKRGFLKAPMLPEFMVAEDGRTVITHDSGILDVDDGQIQSREFDFVLPLSAIPLGRLREVLLSRKDSRELRSILLIPFLWGRGGLFKKKESRNFLSDLMKGLDITSVYALAPAEELWLKPFTEWTDGDWQERCHSLFWDMQEDTLYAAKGNHPRSEIKKVGDVVKSKGDT